MDPKEKEKMAEELNVEETKDTAEEQPQNDQAEEAAPLTHEEQLEKELEDAQAVIEEQKDKYLRLSAEFDNYRKRTMKPLDTDYHEAIAVIPAPSEEQKGKILDCVQTGYTLNDKVIRHAKVVVGE